MGKPTILPFPIYPPEVWAAAKARKQRPDELMAEIKDGLMHRIWEEHVSLAIGRLCRVLEAIRRQKEG